ncbi:hypothetical protein HOG17_04910 [Candidatus Peregrinibacteria bacterium]|jgi:hypothetical protein|nr:hypothetical protein [Candidatus Peregrinibacteria bacterium]MBT4148522.1 hypothetical protein [Candidatus Peregrinibacteria bacterium]MBT4365867.1 hypothetical protein [Candidatus Peregrinibacteria bacterium]MBT4455535.1 hypothetical protein [Candidatus Peregrinibacteria bacterium]
MKALENTPIEEVPMDILFKLQEPMIINNETIAGPEDHLIVINPQRLPIEMHHRFEQLKATPETAYVILEIRDNVFGILLLKDFIHQGQGESIPGESSTIKPGFKSDISISRITAEPLERVQGKAAGLPEGQTLFLATNYNMCTSDGITRFNKLPEDKNLGAAPNVLVQSILARKGDILTLFRKGEKLMAIYADEQPFEIAPDCELEVTIPKKPAAAPTQFSLEDFNITGLKEN